MDSQILTEPVDTPNTDCIECESGYYLIENICC